MYLVTFVSINPAMNRFVTFTFFLASILVLISISPLKGQCTFVVKDVLVSDPDASIIDPEYNIPHNIVCWQSEDKELWVCRLDLATRAFVPPDGKGYLVDVDLTPPTPGGWNGPEWMLSTDKTQIVYNQKKGGVRYPGLATQVLGGWSSTTLMQYPETLYSMASRNYSDSVGMFLFESSDVIGIHWVKSNDLNTSYFYPDVTLGFFADDQQQICCAIDHSRQPGFLETQVLVPHFNMISLDTIGAPFMWNDPESGSRMYMYRTNGSQTIKIFQENIDGNWYLYHSFNSPLPSPYIYLTSPEPFVFGGKSYISFMAAQSTIGMDEMPAQIWISSINPNDNLMRRVSDSSEAVRIDPEPVVFSDSAFIYYTEKIHTRFWHHLHRVRKCDTGLALLNTGLKAETSSSAALSIYPNPSEGHITISPSNQDFRQDSHIQVYDHSGRFIRNIAPGPFPLRADLSDLPPGAYHLRLISGEECIDKPLFITR